VDRGGVGKPVETDGARRRPAQRGAHDRALVVPDERGRIAVQTIVERAETDPAEPVEIPPADDRSVDADRHARRQRGRAEQ
jgi:hypothetical protein